MLAGRIGSGIAAELGSMVVTDQINALRALGTDPIRKLVVPRVLAGFFMAPVLTVIADTLGIIGGWLIAVFQLRVASSLYWSSVSTALYLQTMPGWVSSSRSPRLRRNDYWMSRRVAHSRGNPGCGPGHDERRRRLFGGGDCGGLFVTRLLITLLY